MSEPPPASGPIRVGVRALCEFTAKSGDLDLRFTPAPSGAEGVAGHRRVAERRGAGYEREVRLHSEAGPLQIHGRADGLRPEGPDGPELEEIKTHRGPAARIPANHRALHWAQLRLYGAQLCRERGLDQLRLTLVHFDVDRDEESTESETCEAAELARFHDEQAERYAGWALQERAHRQCRDAALGQLAFPHPQMHAGQRQLAEAVYRRVRDGGALLAQAPTGIGKSIGTLFPALRAMPAAGIDKLFFLTAKTSGRRSALDALAALQPTAEALPLRVLELVARDKACEHPGSACHGEACPLARGFYDRLPAARAAAVARRWLDRDTLRAVAREHRVCPYYLSQDLVRWADVVVGDVNYWFDASALLHALSVAHEWRVSVLVDEAHNLVERARGMYSIELLPQRLFEATARAPRALKPRLRKLREDWQRLGLVMASDHELAADPPKAFGEALKPCLEALGEYFAERPAESAPELQRLYFDLLRYAALAEVHGPHALYEQRIAEPARGQPDALPIAAIRNVVPAPFLAPRHAAAASLVAFSATLAPAHYYRDLLGLPDATPWLDVPSPFAPEQLDVRLVREVSTRYRDRPRSVEPIVREIAAQYARVPGNYLAFFSSFDYLERIADCFARRAPEVPAWRQFPGMSEAARDAYLARFQPDGCGIGFAVLGGAFAEGVDLPGSRLIGAFVATLGLPQVNPLNEAIAERLEASFGPGSGQAYGYLYPGLQKVVQAAGRVIRTPSDRGTLLLIDPRYERPEVRALLPGWWRLPEPRAWGPPSR